MIKEFLESFGETELPALYSTVRGISEITEDSDVPIEKLADIIKSDASMTAHILRHTQGAYRIPLKGKHNTVNRAIVMLGFREVRALCLTLSVIGGLSSDNATEAFVAELAKIFHGATQARSIALLRGERACEEVFTTAILSRIGHLMFWASSDSRVELLHSAYKGRMPNQYAGIEKAVLGFTLADLSRQVMESWNLGEYSRSPDLITNNEEIRFDATELGMELAENAVNGWDNASMDQVVTKISAYLDLTEDVVKATVKENSMIASQVSDGFNMGGVGQEIVKTHSVKTEMEDRMLDEESEEIISEASFDPAYQLKVLNEIGLSLESGVDINRIIGMTLEGVYRGVGFDRVLFALMTPNKKQLRGKAGIGQYYQKALFNFKINIDSDSPSVFTHCMTSGESMWLTQGLAEEANVSREFKNSLPAPECIIVPLVVSKRSIGLFYADKGTENKTITKEDYGSLKQFVFQIQLALEHMQKSSRASAPACASDQQVKI